MGYYMAGGLLDDLKNALAPGGAQSIVKGTGALIKAASPWANDTPPSDHRRYRRMNPGNVRALRRSMRRVQAFAKLARHTIAFTHHVKMKKHRRK
jgi:hypothetical protein